MKNLKQQILRFGLLFAIVFISACFSGPEKKLLGLWKRNSDSYIEIKRNGSAIQFNQYQVNLHGTGATIKEFPAEIKDGALVLSGPFNAIALLHKVETDEIVVGGRHSYKRVTNSDELEKLKKLVQSDRDNNDLCKKIKSEVREMRNKDMEKTMQNAEWNAFVHNVHSRAPKGCLIFGPSKR